MPTYLSSTKTKEGYIQVKLATKEPASCLDVPLGELLGNYKYDYELIRDWASAKKDYHIYEVLRRPHSHTPKLAGSLALQELELGLAEVMF